MNESQTEKVFFFKYKQCNKIFEYAGIGKTEIEQSTKTGCQSEIFDVFSNVAFVFRKKPIHTFNLRAQIT